MAAASGPGFFGLLFAVFGIGFSAFQLSGDWMDGGAQLTVIKWATSGQVPYFAVVPVLNMAMDLISLIVGVIGLAIGGSIGLLLNVVGMVLGASGMLLGFAFLLPGKLSEGMPPAFRNMLLTGELVGALSETENLIAYSQGY